MVFDYYDQDHNPEDRAKNKMAPTKAYKMGYQKFMNFQRLYVFQTDEA